MKIWKSLLNRPARATLWSETCICAAQSTVHQSSDFESPRYLLKCVFEVQISKSLSGLICLLSPDNP